MFDMRNMYQLTVFLPMSFENLKESLKGLEFKEKNRTLSWEMDGLSFTISPFSNQSSHDKHCGYRVRFNTDLEVGLYLFDTSLGWLKPFIPAIEYQLYEESSSKQDYLKRVRKNNKYQMGESINFFQKEGVGITILDDCIHLQYRSVNKKPLSIVAGVEKISKIQEELSSVSKVDLFSFAEERMNIG